jgi:hypothetical protein
MKFVKDAGCNLRFETEADASEFMKTLDGSKLIPPFIFINETTISKNPKYENARFEISPVVIS